MRIGAIEAGGTKFVCGIGNEEGVIEDRVSFPTENPESTMANVIAYFEGKGVEAIGIGTFGPIDIDKASPTYGHVTTTPKPGWSGFDFLGTMKRNFDVPFGWDTDVNAAAFGEATWGAAKGLDSCVYYTVGTGIGVGVYSEGKLVHGLVHPEGGHVLTRRHADDDYEGFCPYHGDCLEGMAAGPALEKRWKVKGSELAVDHPAWALEAYYLGQAVSNVILMLSPKKVILGGGVMHQLQLFPMIREEVRKQLNGYVSAKEIVSGLDSFIVPPGLGDNAGLSGSLALGLDALKGK
ncbi:ROK family protein [Paenibacillus radicis (ex Gao et al. 2016)]|uniref:fructokinase n=1 Tax=Paenibacillus radicis (ex Gao et al. 2016) TaxID=1737354 RepID=A0A917GY30_9BACL|nr:ROK family protein [Paenibacillus radicis (ex Gao et al. 2016)]GGG61528.1 putative fructokinase [Paenibacillus radicis (ex Gao et al. 2016)]